MLGWIGQQVRDVQMAGVGLALTLASAVIGLVWLSIAIAGALASLMGSAPAAALLTATAFLLPPLALFIWRAFDSGRRKREQEMAQQFALSGQPDLLASLTRIAQDMAERSPLAAVAVAALGGLLAARFPAALPLLVQALSRQET